MAPNVALITHILATGILFADIFIGLLVLLMIMYVLEISPEFFNGILSFFERWGVLVAFLSTLGSLLGSLYYSEIVGFLPCELCVIQRIFMYPLVVVLGLAVFKKGWSKILLLITTLFSIAGTAVGIFHYYGQMFNASALPCDATGAVSCAKIEFIEYGYITIPIMAVTSFLIVLVSLSLRTLALRREARMPLVK